MADRFVWPWRQQVAVGPADRRQRVAVGPADRQQQVAVGPADPAAASGSGHNRVYRPAKNSGA